MKMMQIKLSSSNTLNFKMKFMLFIEKSCLKTNFEWLADDAKILRWYFCRKWLWTLIPWIRARILFVLHICPLSVVYFKDSKCRYLNLWFHLYLFIFSYISILIVKLACTTVYKYIFLFMNNCHFHNVFNPTLSKIALNWRKMYKNPFKSLYFKAICKKQKTSKWNKQNSHFDRWFHKR